MRVIDNIPVFGTAVDEGALTQIKVCAQNPRASSCALITLLMPYFGKRRSKKAKEIFKRCLTWGANGNKTRRYYRTS